MKQAQVILKPIPEVTERLPGDRLVEFFRKLGWDGNREVNPALVKLHRADWQAVLSREMDYARETFREEMAPPEVAVGVGFLWMNWGPSSGGATPGMVELHPGWIEEE